MRSFVLFDHFYLKYSFLKILNILDKYMDLLVSFCISLPGLPKQGTMNFVP